VKDGDNTYKAVVYYKTGSGYKQSKVFHVSAPEIPLATRKVYSAMIAPHLIYKITVTLTEGEIIL
jgi:hypothetical protein